MFFPPHVDRRGYGPGASRHSVDRRAWWKRTARGKKRRIMADVIGCRSVSRLRAVREGRVVTLRASVRSMFRACDIACLAGGSAQFGSVSWNRMRIESACIALARKYSKKGVIEVSTGLFLVTRTRGPGWDATRSLEAQELWTEHAEFMMALVHDGFVTLGGPVLETPEVLLVVKAATALEAERRLALDPWTLSGHLQIARIQSWQLRLGKLA